MNEEVITGELSESGEKHTFTFTVGNGESVLISASDTNEGDFSPRLSLYSPSGSLINNSFYGDGVALLKYWAPASGTYTIELDDFAYYVPPYQPALYNLRFVRIPGANEGGELISGSITSGTLDLGDLDTFTFLVNSGETIKLSATDLNDNGFSPKLSLYSPSGAPLSSNFGSSLVTLNYWTTVGGIYTVVINDSGYYVPPYQPAAYDLQLNLEP